jgi:HK97 family phage portal protein
VKEKKLGNIITRIPTLVKPKGGSTGFTQDDAKFWRSNRSFLNSTETLTVDDPYKSNVWVFASINAIAQNISRVPFYMYTEKSKDIKKIMSTGKLADLFTNPNPFMIQSTLFFATFLYLELFGEAFWVLEGRKNITEIPTEIWTYSPQRFEPLYEYISGSKNKIFNGYWKYSVGSYEVNLAPYEVLHIKYYNPYDDIRGIAPLEASKLGVEQDYFANKYNKQFFKDGASLSGIIESPDWLTDDQYNRLGTQFNEKHAGYSKAHKVGVIEGGAKFTETKAMSQRDMEFSVLKKVIRGEILAAYKTNEVVLGNYENIQCFHPDTDVMTINGFKPIEDIKVDDLLATLNNEGIIEYKPVTETYEYDYDGEVYTQHEDYNTYIDFCVTPEHKMFGELDGEITFKKIKDIEKDLCDSGDAFWEIYAEDDNINKKGYYIVAPKRISYKGKVYCLKIPPFHNICTKYNGKIMWCGNSYEGISMAHASFWKETLLPKMTYLEEFLWAKFFSKINVGRFWGGFDFSAIEALRDDFGKKVEIAKELWAMGFTGNEINKRLDLGFEEKDWRDTWWIKVGISPVEDIMNGKEPTEVAPIDEESGNSPDEPEEEEEPVTNPDDSKKYYDNYILKQQTVEELFNKKIKRFFFEQRKRVITEIYKSEVYNFDTISESELLTKLLTGLYEVAVETGIELLKDEVELEYDDSLIVEEFIKSRIKFSSYTIINTLNKNIEKLLNGSKDEQVTKIRSFYNKADNRIATIARTESACIINGVRYYLMKANGFKKHKWISSKSENGRHKELNGKIVELGKSFINDSILKYPNDSEAPANMIIGCLCYAVVV